jgi:hypothetical protein
MEDVGQLCDMDLAVQFIWGTKKGAPLERLMGRALAGYTWEHEGRVDMRSHHSYKQSMTEVRMYSIM